MFSVLKNNRSLLLAMFLLAFMFLLVDSGKVNADTVYFEDGTYQEGKVILDNGSEVWIEVSAGKNTAVVKVPKSKVVKIDKGKTEFEKKMDLYTRKLAEIDQSTASDWFKLGSWCEKETILKHKAKECFEKAIELDYEYSPAHIKLGHVRHEGAWMDYDTMMLSKGFVKFEGSWMSIETKMAFILKEKELAILREQSRIKNLELRLAEAEQRVAEAESRIVRTSTTVPVYTRYVNDYSYSRPVYSPLWYGISYHKSHKHSRHQMIYPSHRRYPYSTRRHKNPGALISYTRKTRHSSLGISFFVR